MKTFFTTNSLIVIAAIFVGCEIYADSKNQDEDEGSKRKNNIQNSCASFANLERNSCLCRLQKSAKLITSISETHSFRDIENIIYEATEVSLELFAACTVTQKDLQMKN